MNYLLRRPDLDQNKAVKMAAPSQRTSAHRFSVYQALLLLYQWNADSDSESSSSSSTGSVSESSDSDGDTATARIGPQPLADSTRPTPATEFDIVIDLFDADDGKCYS